MKALVVIDLQGQPFSFPLIPPGQIGPRRKAKGDGAEEGRSRGPALVVAEPGVACRHLIETHRFRNSEGGDDLPRFKHLEGQGPGAALGQGVAHHQDIVAEGGKLGAKGHGEAPAKGLLGRGRGSAFPGGFGTGQEAGRG